MFSIAEIYDDLLQLCFQLENCLQLLMPKPELFLDNCENDLLQTNEAFAKSATSTTREAISVTNSPPKLEEDAKIKENISTKQCENENENECKSEFSTNTKDNDDSTENGNNTFTRHISNKNVDSDDDMSIKPEEDIETGW